jgi:hypothetical protein
MRARTVVLTSFAPRGTEHAPSHIAAMTEYLCCRRMMSAGLITRCRRAHGTGLAHRAGGGVACA